MVRHITSKATVESSDEDEGTGLIDDEGTGLVDDEDSNSSVLSSSSDRRNDDSPLIQAIDKILTGKSKSKGKGKEKKTQNTQGTEQDARNKPPAPEDGMDSESARKFMFNIAMFSTKERSKDLKKQIGKNTYMDLNNEPFDTWSSSLSGSRNTEPTQTLDFGCSTLPVS
ncbi:hypothetical protein K443DRAFT_10667 [Laccaria amethystina LaAM-08-1]|uniref:Uncharacterized protein n=1 Tax=Laccaria amethystina LaAM-08-1 TaxID=1095629 RepID=A0A0C9WKI1_9AGAR|nr:hypothetical protein K443DRAFT_10667 [Laccaria amethystina LaAM-08-1]